MSEAAPEQVPSSGGGGNPLTRKLGPMPLWAWMLVAFTVALGYAYWRNRQSSSAAATSSGGSTGDTAASADIPQFVNQVYTNPTPPTQPNTPINVTLSGNPAQPVVTQTEGSAGTTPQGLSITPVPHGAHIGFGPVPGATQYKVYIFNDKTNKVVYNRNVPTTHPQISGLAPGSYTANISAVGFTGTATKKFTVKLWLGHMSK